jgi:hypothetical protein
MTASYGRVSPEAKKAKRAKKEEEERLIAGAGWLGSLDLAGEQRARRRDDGGQVLLSPPESNQLPLLILLEGRRTIPTS